jgi:hypothetical protein
MTVGSRFRKRIRLISDAWINLTKIWRYPLCGRPASYDEPQFKGAPADR